MPPKVICKICNEQPSKYRCPLCNTKYCSLMCYKAHKSKAIDEQNSCNPPKKESSSSNSTCSTKNDRFENKKRRRDHTEEEVCHVTPKELQRLEASEPVRKAAKSAQLQQVVRGIINARDPHIALARRLEQDPHFSTFADNIMIAIGKAERGPNGQVRVL